MAEYIEREALLAEIANMTIVPNDLYDYGIMAGIDAVKNKVAEAPAADVVPVVHGRWIPKNSRNPFSWRYCSECKHTVTAAQARVYAGCPMCLARMDGE